MIDEETRSHSYATFVEHEKATTERIAFPILHAVTPQKNTIKKDHHAMMFCQMFFDVSSTTSSGQRDMTALIPSTSLSWWHDTYNNGYIPAVSSKLCERAFITQMGICRRRKSAPSPRDHSLHTVSRYFLGWITYFKLYIKKKGLTKEREARSSRERELTERRKSHGNNFCMRHGRQFCCRSEVGKRGIFNKKCPL